MQRIYQPIAQYIGQGNQSQYTFNFEISQLSDLYVLVTDSNYNFQFFVPGTDTTNLAGVTFNTGPNIYGGTVTLAMGNLPTGWNITMILSPDMPVQLSRFRNNGDWTLENIELALDYINSTIQRVAYLAQRSAHLSDDLDTSQVPFDTQIRIFSTNQTLQATANCVLCVNPAGV
jgi:hypothetical protein